MDAHKSRAGEEIDRALRELIPGFLENRRRDLAALRVADAAGNHESLLRIAHGLRGEGAIYGYPEIGACGLIEEAASRGEDQAVSAAIDALEGCLSRATPPPA